jgi:DUF4097 and DUF4098 domain-containing protein YvlB
MNAISKTGLILSLALALSGNALAEERLFDKQFAANAGGTLKFDTDFGDVTISGSDSNQVTIHAVIKGDQRPVKDYEISAESSNESVILRGRNIDYDWFDSPSLKVTYTIQVPRNYDVQVHSARGNLELRDFNGKVFADSSRGNVNVVAINGSIQIDSSRGNVHGSRLTGSVRAASSRGNIEFDQVEGPMDLSNSRGNVNVKLVNTNHGANIDASRGNINIQVPKQFAANLNARADRGTIHSDLPITTTDRSFGHRQDTLIGTINGGGKELRIDASRGNVSINAGM